MAEEKRPDISVKAQDAQVIAAVSEDAQLKRRRRRIRALRSFLIRLVLLAAVLYVLLFHIIGITTMPGEDMSPRLSTGDLLLFYRIDRNPKAQDIVVIDRKDTGKRYVSRVVAGPGDTVDISDESGLKVNGSPQVEPKIFYPTKPYVGQVEFPVMLGEDEYFVLADYRNGGADSRYFGPVKQEEIQGIVITVLRRNSL